MLKIDRMEAKELVVIDDKVEYSQDEIMDLVNRIDVGNRTRVGQRPGTGVSKVVSAFGIVGMTPIYVSFVLSSNKITISPGNTPLSSQCRLKS